MKMKLTPVLALGLNLVLMAAAEAQRMPQDSWYLAKEMKQSSDQDTHGIAADAEDNIFISYHQANLIYKFSPELVFIKSFGATGSGDGQFNGVLEMAIGSNQRLYVVDHSGHRVQYFDLDGNYLGKFGGEGTGNGNFKYPWGIAVSKDNKVYVADRGNHRIQIFDENGNYLSKFGTQGSFYGQFQSPHGVALFPNGNVAVADYGNKRVQTFNHEGKFLKNRSYYDLANQILGTAYYVGNDSDRLNPEYVFSTQDGLLGVSGKTYTYRELDVGSKFNRESRISFPILIADSQLAGIKGWVPPGLLTDVWGEPPSHGVYYNDSHGGPIAELKGGDLIVANKDRVVRVWKRTFRTVHPEPASALPLPSIVAQLRRPGTALVDVDYTVKDLDSTTVQTAALAFKNGGNSLADVIPITSFAEGTGSKLGANIATGQAHRFTWDVARDWSTDFGEVQLEILAKDGRDLLNLDFIQLPASGDEAALKISRSPLTDNDFLSIWYWLIATGDPGIRLENGNLISVDGSTGYDGGLLGEYFENKDFSGDKFTRFDSVPGTHGENVVESVPGAEFLAKSIRWTAEFVPSQTGTYRFTGEALGELTVTAGNQTIIDGPVHGPINFTLDAVANEAIPIVFEICQDTNNSWSPNERILRFWAVILPGDAGQRGLNISDFQSASNLLAQGTVTKSLGRNFLLQKMGLREATAAEVTRAKEAGTPGVINQWDPKLRVGPDERPAKINAYGFDTGSDGYWVVPVDGN